MTEIIKIDNQKNKVIAIERATEILRKGGLIAFPTDTVYGLGVDGLNSVAVDKLYSLKGRSYQKPLIILLAEHPRLNELAVNIPNYIDKVINKFWPGPLTIILEKADFIPDKMTCRLGTVGLRCPGQHFLLDMLAQSGIFLASTSANISGEKEAREINEINPILFRQIDLIIDDGPTPLGQPSTVVDFTGPEPKIIRQGKINLDEIMIIIKTEGEE